ncbi:MAG: hypothetical protein AB1716_12805 [Planctomycetota bacterium]
MVRVRHVWPAMLLIAAATARSSPGDTYWVNYQASSGLFPEEAGWTRYTREGGDQRWFEDGWLVMDGTADPRIQDYNRFDRSLDPAPGEEFIVQWRISVDQLSGYYDPAIGVFSDEQWGVGFVMSLGDIKSQFEQNVSASFAPGVAHTFELRSRDMRAYSLSIDGLPAISGSFWLSLSRSHVAWGDGVYGAASLARWEFVRFGVVPEPDSGICLVTGAALGLFGFRSRQGRSSRRVSPNVGEQYPAARPALQSEFTCASESDGRVRYGATTCHAYFGGRAHILGPGLTFAQGRGIDFSDM